MGQFITFCWGQSVAGGENYVNSRVAYLEKTGWRPLVFISEEYSEKEIPWNNLKKYKNLKCSALRARPKEFYPIIIQRTLKWMESFVDKNNLPILIESHSDYQAEWGELLAKRLKAKHVCFLLDERLDEYGAKDFLYYKYKRGEVATIHKRGISDLFKNTEYVDNSKNVVLVASHYNDTVQDINSLVVDKISNKFDWTIGYMGRNKAYVPYICDGIRKFALRYPMKSIQFLIVGSIGDEKDFPDNVHLKNLGFFRPIPRKLFSKLDVVIAGSGCARTAASEGVPVIVADCRDFKANGVLGIDLNNTLLSNEEKFEYSELLNRVLVDKLVDDFDFGFSEDVQVDKYFEEIMEFSKPLHNDKKYYPVFKEIVKNQLQAKLQTKYLLKE